VSSEKEISSTEKLLGVIRGKEPPEAVKKPETPPAKEVPKPARGPVRAVPVKGATMVGLECGKDAFRFVKIGQAADGGYRFVECAQFPHTAKGMDDPEFGRSLKNALKAFSKGGGKQSLWAVLPAPDAEVGILSIPKVPKKQLDQAVLFVAHKAMTFDEKQHVFDYDIRGEVMESGVAKLAAVAYAVPRNDVNRLQKHLEEAGYPPEGLTILPFALQNLFKSRWVPSPEGNAAVLSIGEEGSLIEIFTDGEIQVTRWIRAGLESMIQELVESVNGRIERGGPAAGPGPGEPPPPTMEEPGKFLPPEEARALVLDLFAGTDRMKGIREKFHLEQDEVFDLIRPAVERLIRQVERTFEHFTTVLGRDRINALHITGAVRIFSRLVDYIGGQLAVDCRILDPLAPQHPATAGGATASMDAAERTLYGTALGAALSGPVKSLNLLSGYDRKRAAQTEAKASRIVLSLAAAALAACLVALAVFGYNIYERKNVLAGLEKQLLRDARLNEETIAPLIAKVKAERQHIEKYRERYLDLAAINEIATLTPSNIRLVNVRLDLGGLEAGADKKAAGEPRFAPPKGVIIEGLVTGDETVLDSTLAGYVLKIQTSPMFSGTEVTKNTPETFDSKKVLRFILNAKFA